LSPLELNNPNILVSAGTNGIVAQSAGGDVLISGTGRNLTGNGTAGDDGLAGNVSLTMGVPGNISASGILALTSGSGNATVRLAAANAGNATVLANTRGTVTVSNADYSAGIRASTESGNIAITLLDNPSSGASVAVTSSSTGGSNVGIEGKATAVGNATSGSVVINTGVNNAVAVSGDNSIGVWGQSSTGGVTVTTGTGSTLTVTANASGNVSENPLGFPESAGIVAGATSSSATGNVLVTNNAAISVSNNAASSTTGIFAFNNGNGTVVVTNNATITSNGGSAIASLGTGGVVTVNNNASIRGLGTSTGTAVVRASGSFSGNVSSITLNNNAGGTIASIGGLASDLAIAVTTTSGTITVINGGRITGSVNFSGAAASAFNNSSALSWHTSGTSTFTNGFDVLNNFGNGLIATSGATTFNFLDSAVVTSGNVTTIISDNFINAATVIVGETTGASSLTIAKGNGTMTMTNSGTIVLGSLNGGASTDGQTNDRFFGKTAGVAFVSSGNSRVKIDAFLGAGAEAQRSPAVGPAGGTGCALTAAFADCMTIGASSGTGTRISINDTNASGAGALNLTGTVVVDGTTGSAGDFFLSTSDANVVMTAQGPAIRKGFVQYQLTFDSTNVDWDIVGLPSSETFELSKLTATLQTLWYETSDSWNERTTAARATYADGTMPGGWSIWGKVYYGQINRDSENSLDVLGTSFTTDTGYRQTYTGFQFGVDYMARGALNGAWILGLLTGYNKSRVEFSASDDNVDISAYNVGLYASYMNGPLFADLLVKDDFASVNFDLPSFSALEDVSANDIGAQFTVGGRFGRRFVFEPMGTVAYVRTSVGNMDWQGMSFDWEDGSSFRGTLALRISGNLGGDQAVLQPFILGGIGREFNSENKLSLTTGGSDLSISDKPIQTFEIISLGFNVLGNAGWSAYIRGDGLFATDYRSAAIRIGVRIR